MSSTFPVAVIGAGPVGLVSSFLLSQLGIHHVVFEQFPDTSIHPKALGLNQRTVEIFRRIGVEEELKRHKAPPDSVSHTAWYTNLGPDRVEICTRESWGRQGQTEEYRLASPCQYSTLPQIRLEPILKKRALELKPGVVRYNHRVLSVVEDGDSVALEVAESSIHDGAKSTKKFRARYVLGANGGRGLAEQLGIVWEGGSDLVHMETAHFRSATLESIGPDPRVFISWIINPKLGGSRGSGYVYHIGPYFPERKPETDEWVFATPVPEEEVMQNGNEGPEPTRDAMLARIKLTLDLPDLDIDLLSITHWTVNAKVTSRYRNRPRRVFLVGDACHRIPPWGALGMNTGIQDAANLIWKLALVLSGEAGEALLDTYQIERKPIAVRIARQGLTNMENHPNVMDATLGVGFDKTEEANLEAVAAFVSPKYADHTSKREAVKKASKILDAEFHAPGLEIGWFNPCVDVENEGGVTRHDGQICDD